MVYPCEDCGLWLRSFLRYVSLLIGPDGVSGFHVLLAADICAVLEELVGLEWERNSSSQCHFSLAQTCTPSHTIPASLALPFPSFNLMCELENCCYFSIITSEHLV